MAAKRAHSHRQHWPRGLYETRPGYYTYRSPISRRTMALGAIPEAEAIAYAQWADKQAGAAEFEDKVGRVRAPHAQIDERGLLEPAFIAKKAMTFDRIVGVYFLLRDDTIVYVGQSTSIMTRLANHKIEGVKEFNRVFVVECPAGDLDRLERMYINKFKPIYNASQPAIDPKAPVWSENVRALLGDSLHSVI